jgi:hypothetical protein
MKMIIGISCSMLLLLGGWAYRGNTEQPSTHESAVQTSGSTSATDSLATENADSIFEIVPDSCPKGLVLCVKGCCAPRGTCRQICGS